MRNKKTLLICGNGMSGEVIKDVKKWGYNVALISEFPNEVGVSDADYFIETNTKFPEQALSAANKLQETGIVFSGVISLCWDCAPSVALIAKEYGLRSVSIETAEKASKKDIRSAAFESANVPAPKYRIASSYEELVTYIQEFQFPLILKPVDLSSCKGVILVESKKDLATSYSYAQSFSKLPEVVINEYLHGTEHSTEGLMIDSKLYMTAISDRHFKYDECKPYFVEIGDVMPTILDETKQHALSEVTEKAALSLGIFNGVVKADLIYCEERGPFVLEIAARLGGPRFGTEMVPLSNGTNILRATIQQALGEKIDFNLLRPKYHRGMVNRSLFPKVGRIKSINGIDKLKDLPGFYDFKWWGSQLKPGDIITPYENACGNVGYFIATGSTREEAIRNADRIENSIQFEII